MSDMKYEDLPLISIQKNGTEGNAEIDAEAFEKLYEEHIKNEARLRREEQ